MFVLSAFYDTSSRRRLIYIIPFISWIEHILSSKPFSKAFWNSRDYRVYYWTRKSRDAYETPAALLLLRYCRRAYLSACQTHIINLLLNKQIDQIRIKLRAGV